MSEIVQSGADAVAAAAKTAVDVSLSAGAFGGFSFSLKIDNPWLAAGIAIGSFYLANKVLTERALKRALERQSTEADDRPDPEVIETGAGSILVQLVCHTRESFLSFTDDLESKKVKYRLEEELSRVGFCEEIRLTVENQDEFDSIRYFPVCVTPRAEEVRLGPVPHQSREESGNEPPVKRKCSEAPGEPQPWKSGDHGHKTAERKFYKLELYSSIWEVPERYKSVEPIGYDTHGALCTALDEQINETVLIKKLHRPFDSVRSCLLTFREICLLKHVRHESIMQLHDLFTPQQRLGEFSSAYLVYKALGAHSASLAHVKGHDVGVTDDHLKFLTYQLLRALKYLHSMDLVLRDLAPHHVAVNTDCELLIQNLASARRISTLKAEDDRFLTGYIGYRYCRAPELILGNPYDGKVDIWSAGCIFAELLTGQVLFSGNDHIDMMMKIFKIRGTPQMEFIQKCKNERAQQFLMALPSQEKVNFSEHFQSHNPSAGFVGLLEKMLMLDPSERVSAEEALRDPYLGEYHDPEDEPSGKPFDDSFEQWKNLSTDEWKERIFAEVQSFVA